MTNFLGMNEVNMVFPGMTVALLPGRYEKIEGCLQNGHLVCIHMA